MAFLNGSSRADVIKGSAEVDWIDGGAGNDTLSGMGGSDFLFGGSGNDTLDGGTGSDYLDGGTGDDLLIYRMSENKNAIDIYNGWTGRDTLRLQLTGAEWARADVKADVARFAAYLVEYNEPFGWVDDPLFSFKAFGLNVIGINKLELVVDGKVVTVPVPKPDAPVLAVNDTLAATEDAGVTIDVLANDTVADGVATVTIAQPSRGTATVVSTDFAAAKPSAVIRFTPGEAFQSLAAGQTATEVFSYTVTDKDGDTKTATVQVTVTGTNDGPVVRAKTEELPDNSYYNAYVGSVADAASDVDQGDALTFEYVPDNPWGWDGFYMQQDGTWTYDRDYAELKAGETLSKEFRYKVTDSAGAEAFGTLVLTFVGDNDANVFGDTAADLAEMEEYGETPGVHEFAIYGSGPEASWQGDRLVTVQDIYSSGDIDSAGGSVTTLTPVGEGHVGTFVLTDNGYGGLTQRFEISKAELAAIGEGEYREQYYDVTVNDGQGAITYQRVLVRVYGDGDDPVELEQVDYGRQEEVGGKLTGTDRIYLYDEDIGEAISVTVAAAGDDAFGVYTVGEVVETDSYGRRYVDVSYAFDIATAEARDLGLAFEQFRITVADTTGSSFTVDRTVRVRDDGLFAGGTGDELIEAYGDSATVTGGGGADRLVGGYGDDRLSGDAAPAYAAGFDNKAEPDAWTPVAGFDDELDGSYGADTMTGGAGADRFILRAWEADGDVITDFDYASGDRIVLRDWDQGATITSLGGGVFEVSGVTFGEAMTERFTLTGVETLADDAWSVELPPPPPTLYQVGDAESETNITPWDDGNLVIVGNGGTDFLSGGRFDDTIYGDSAPDLPAEYDNQWMGYERDSDSNQGFDDWLDGSWGADTLIGGEGGDLFLFYARQTEGDAILDFNAAEGDRISFDGFEDGAVLTDLGGGRYRFGTEDYGETFTLANGAVLTANDWFIGL